MLAVVVVAQAKSYTKGGRISVPLPGDAILIVFRCVSNEGGALACQYSIYNQMAPISNPERREGFAV